MQHSFLEDPMKQLNRDAYAGFIRRHKKPKELRNASVLCMSGPEMSEVLALWDGLKVKRKNITSVEKGDDEYIELEERVAQEPEGQRIKTEKADILDFLRTTDKQFDFIFLDYCGMFDSDVRQAAYTISRRQLLKENGIVAINIREGREDLVKQSEYVLATEWFDSGITVSFDDIGTESYDIGALEEKLAREVIQEYEKHKKTAEENKDKLKEFRRTSLARTIIYGMFCGKIQAQMPELYPPELIEWTVKSVRKMYAKVNELTEGLLFKREPMFARAYAKNDVDTLMQHSWFMIQSQIAIINHFQKLGSNSNVFHYLEAKARRPYFLQDMECFRYTSQPGNSSMFGAIGLFDQRRDFFDENNIGFYFGKENGTLMIYNGDTRKAQREIKRAEERFYKKAQDRSRRRRGRNNGIVSREILDREIEGIKSRDLRRQGEYIRQYMQFYEAQLKHMETFIPNVRELRL